MPDLKAEPSEAKGTASDGPGEKGGAASSSKTEGYEDDRGSEAETMSHGGDSCGDFSGFITVAEDKDDARCRAAPAPGLGLDIMAAVEVSDAKDLSDAAAVIRKHEAGVLVVFELPDGSQVNSDARSSPHTLGPARVPSRD